MCSDTALLERLYDRFMPATWTHTHGIALAARTPGGVSMAKDEKNESPLEEGRRNTEIRRDTAIRGSMGEPASGENTETVSPETDVFGDEDELADDRSNLRRHRADDEPE